MVEQFIVGTTGAGYLIVGILQFSKGAIPNGILWIGYAIGQVGLYLNLK